MVNSILSRLDGNPELLQLIYARQVCVRFHSE